MILDLFTGGQWTVIMIVSLIVFWTVFEVVLAKQTPWGSRTKYDAPPVLGGLVFATGTVFVGIAVIGLIHWLTWMWLYG